MAGRAAFDTYLNWLARDMVDKSHTLQSQNESMKAARDLLLTVRISALPKLNMLDNDSYETADHVIYPVKFEDQSLRDFAKGHFEVSGVVVMMCCPSCRKIPKMTVHKDGTAELEWCWSSDVSFRGRLNNMAGTTDDWQEMVRTNQIQWFFRNLGETDQASGQVFRMSAPYDCLNNATLTVEQIKIAKHIVQPVRDLDIVRNIENELEFLINARSGNLNQDFLTRDIPEHQVLLDIVIKNKRLTEDNRLLRASRNLLQTVELEYPPSRSLPGGSFNLMLEDGQVWHMSDNGDGNEQRFWVIEPRQETCIPLASLSMMNITLAKKTWTNVPDGPAITPCGHVALKYNPFLWAIFGYDDTLDVPEMANIDLPSYLDDQMTELQPNVSSDFEGPRPELTMRLLYVEIDFRVVKEQLDALGVEVSAKE